MLKKKICRNKIILISNYIKLKDLVFLIQKVYKMSGKIFVIPIFIIRLLKFIFKILLINFPLSEKTIKSLTSKTIYTSSEILSKLNLKKLKTINSKSIVSLLKN